MQKDPDSRPKYADLLVRDLSHTSVCSTIGTAPPSHHPRPRPRLRLVLQETSFLKEYEKKEVDVAGWLKRVMP